MENYKLFDGISKDILKDCDIKDTNDKLLECISVWFDMQLFKIISALHIICQKENCKIIDKRIYDIVDKMLKIKCKCKKSMTGGRLGSAQYLGINEAMYSEENIGIDMQKFDIEMSDVVRKQVGGNSKKYERIIMKVLNIHLRYFNIKMAKEVKDIIVLLLIKEIRCLKEEMIESKGINLKKVKSILKRHSLVH
jgi:hypothetical protein